MEFWCYFGWFTEDGSCLEDVTKTLVKANIKMVGVTLIGQVI